MQSTVLNVLYHREEEECKKRFPNAHELSLLEFFRASYSPQNVSVFKQATSNVSNAGRLYVTLSTLFFAPSFQNMEPLEIPLRSVLRIEKEGFPAGISLYLQNGVVHRFTSFVSRNSAFRTLTLIQSQQNSEILVRASRDDMFAQGLLSDIRYPSQTKKFVETFPSLKSVYDRLLEHTTCTMDLPSGIARSGEIFFTAQHICFASVTASVRSFIQSVKGAEQEEVYKPIHIVIPIRYIQSVERQNSSNALFSSTLIIHTLPRSYTFHTIARRETILNMMDRLIVRVQKHPWVFGMPLGQLIERDMRPTFLPRVIEEVCDALFARGLLEEGIFRVSPNMDALERVVDAYDHGEDVNLDLCDVHLLASLLKRFLADLPDPLLTFDYVDAFLACALLDTIEEKQEAILELVMKLPPLHKRLLDRIYRLLQAVDAAKDKNRMGFENLARVFGPTMLRQRETYFGYNTDPLQEITAIQDVIQVMFKADKFLLAAIEQ